MKQFLAIYLGTSSPEKRAKWEALDEKAKEEREKAGMEAWMAWGQKHHASIISHGSPLGKTKLANGKGVSDTKNLMTAYNIVQAESHEAAAKIFENHPHFTIFPGESVEIMECLPMPEM